MSDMKDVEKSALVTKANSIERIIDDTLIAHERGNWNISKDAIAVFPNGKVESIVEANLVILKKAIEGEAVKVGSIEQAIQVALASQKHGQGIPGYQLGLGDTKYTAKQLEVDISSGKLNKDVILNSKTLPCFSSYEISVDEAVGDYSVSAEFEVAAGKIVRQVTETVISKVITKDWSEIKLKARSPGITTLAMAMMHHKTTNGTTKCAGIDCEAHKSLALGAIKKYSKEQIGQALANQKRALRAGKRLEKKLKAKANKCKGYK